MLDFSGEVMQVNVTFQKFATVAFSNSPIKIDTDVCKTISWRVYSNRISNTVECEIEILVFS